MHRHAREQISKASFAPECLQEALIFQVREDARRDATTQVDATCSQHLQSEVACLRP